VLLDWTRANVAKDWSLTAWGTSGDVVVRNKNTSILSDRMPQYTDNKSDVDPPVPVPEPESEEEENDGDDGITPNPDPTCQDIDNGAQDPWGDTCAEYSNNPNWCFLDFDDFKPTELCCICGGG